MKQSFKLKYLFFEILQVPLWHLNAKKKYEYIKVRASS